MRVNTALRFRQQFLVINCWLIAVFVSLPNMVRADVSWAKGATTCEAFSNELLAYLARLGDLGTLNRERRSELEEVLAEACGERLRYCQFSICKGTQPTVAAAELSSPVPSEERQAESDIKAVIVRNPLQWLDQPMDCEGLLEQIRARYSPLGKFSDLPQEKKAELRQVLDVSCGERFAHCNFKNCKGLIQESGTDSNGGATTSTKDTPKKEMEVSAVSENVTIASKPEEKLVETPTPTPTNSVDAISENELLQKQRRNAELLHQELFEQLRARRNEAIEIAKEEERRINAEWRQLGNPEEQKINAARREAARKRAEQSGTSDVSDQNIPDYKAPYQDQPSAIPRQPRAIPTPAPRKSGGQKGKGSTPLVSPKSIGF